MSAWLVGFKDGLRPDPDLGVGEWAEKYRRLSSTDSAEPGPYRVSRTPYLSEVYECLSDRSPIQRVVLMFAAQTAKTTVGLSWLGYCIQHSPGPAIAVQPTVDMAKRFSRQRVQSMIEDTPTLRELIAPARSRDSDNTMLSKSFPNGILLLTGANSPTGLRSMPARYLFMDEIDAFPLDCGGEGDPVSLAEKRTTTFARRKMLLTSTPTVKDFSRVEKEFLASDQRKWFMPCPSCGHMQVLVWKNLKWEANKPETAKYECEACGDRFEETHKPQMMRGGEWRATKPGDGRTAGFWLNGLNSPLGWASWEDLAREFLQAKEDPARLKSFVNTRLAETFAEESVENISADGLLDRCEAYQPGTVPAEVLCITMGVDVQGGGGTATDRLEVSVWGWRASAENPDNEEGWLIEHAVIAGDPCGLEVWKQLDVYISHEWEHPSGAKFKAECVAVDSGGWATHETYMWAKERQSQGVIAVKGQSTRGKPPIGRPTRQDINRRGVVMRKSAKLWPVGSDTIKSTLMARLKNAQPGPGYLHFHAQTGHDFFQQLTGERLQLQTNKAGFQVPVWVKRPGQRVEALDCLVYAYAALKRLYQTKDRRTVWNQFEARLKGDSLPSLKSKQKQRGRDYLSNW